MKAMTYKVKACTVIAFSLVAIGIAVALFNSALSHSLTYLQIESFSRLAAQQQVAFQREMEISRNNVLSMSKTLPAYLNSPQKTEDIIDSLKEIYTFEAVIIADAQGKAYVQGSGQIDISENKYFYRSRLGEVFTSSPHISSITGEEVFVISAPLYIEDDIVGVVAAEFRVEQFVSLLGLSVYESAWAVIIDKGLNIFFSTNPTLTNKLPIDKAIYYDGDTYQKVLNDILRETPRTVHYSLLGQERISVFRPLGVNDWTILYVLTVDMINENIVGLERLLLLVSCGAAFVFILAISYIFYAEKKSRDKIEKVAFYDELTGLRNIAKFKIDVANILSKNKNKYYYMLKGDIINFKAINELFDHEVGNEVIKTVARVGNELPPEKFIQARLTGDEFLMFGDEDIFADMESIMERYETRFRELLTTAENHQFKFRLGRYRIEPGEADINEIISNTDMAHAIAKGNTRSRYSDYNQEHKQQVIKMTDITNKMEAAVKNEEFEIYLQAKNNFDDENIIGGEALVRWKQADGSMIQPNDFIPVFEENGFITELDKYVFNAVCKILNSWLEKYGTCLPIAVNFSRANLRNPQFIPQLKETAAYWKVPTECLEIELTENTIQDEQADFEAVLEQIKEAGFKVSIDDFGSGYSSLGMLKNLKIDTLKLDRSFFVNQKNKKRGNIVVESFVKLAHSLDMFVVAEGIEEQTQVEFLRDIGCDAAQGYYFGKPMLWTEFEKYLSKK